MSAVAVSIYQQLQTISELRRSLRGDKRLRRAGPVEADDVVDVNAGIAQDRAPAASLPGDRGIESAPRSTMLRALTAGLQRDPASIAAGWKDGEAGRPYRPQHHDAFSYACGYGSARHFKGGKHALRGG